MISRGLNYEINENGALYVSFHCFSEPNTKICLTLNILKQITRAFMYRDRKVFLLLYKQFVRCHLEFAIPAWSPWLVQDIEILERVQKKAVNFIVGLSGKTYEEKLSELNLTSLADRRKKFDLVQTFKILNGQWF